MATVSDSWILSGLNGAQAKDTEPAAPESTATGTTRIHISNQGETTAMRTQPAPSRLTCPAAAVSRATGPGFGTV